MKDAAKWIVVLIAVGAAGPVGAQSWPARPVRVVVPWAPGGATDIIMRPLAQVLSENLKQQFVVDNRGGANSLIGTDIASKAPPDGHTFLFNTLAAFTQNTSYYPKLPYDPEGFILAGQVGWTPILMLAHPSLPVKNVREFIALAKSRPGEITWGSFGTGSSSHFAGALLAIETKTSMIHVPYKGGGPVAVANVAGEVPIHYGGVPPTLGFIKAGRLKPLAVTAAKRTAFLPEVPTVAEALKIRDYDITVTFGMLAPAGTPKPIVDRMHAELGRIVSSPDFKATLTKLGTDETPVMSLADLGAWLRNETARWRRIVELTGIRAD
ncbi:MAG: Bug family tripartite tricarboxylate transporter substrate binding protein [Burkholderiales bacterium]